MTSNTASRSIVVVGAGIIGLDVALVLSQRGFGRNITIVAEHLPGDTNPNYTSPWAGCNYSALSGADANALRWDKLGYAHLIKLSERTDETFVSRTPSTEYWDEEPPRDKIQAMSGYVEDFRVLPRAELPDGVRLGISFTTITVHAPNHIQYLSCRLRDEFGVQFVRQKLPDIQSAFINASTKVVFNCIGNAARSFPGVQDARCYPTRGQVLLTRAPNVRTNMMRHGKDYVTYVIPRPLSNGNVILGGYVQAGSSDSSTYAHETESIVDRTLALSSELREGNSEVLAAFAGLRPSRSGGARVERQELSIAGKTQIIVHNYGAGGTGYQAGYGMALDAVDTVSDVLRTVEQSQKQAKL